MQAQSLQVGDRISWYIAPDGARVVAVGVGSTVAVDIEFLDHAGDKHRELIAFAAAEDVTLHRTAI